MAGVDVRDVTPADRVAWDRLWSANCAHYGAAPSADDNDELWCRLVDIGGTMGALIACRPGVSTPLGFAHYVLHPHTFSARMVCYLEDLWVEPATRGSGVGRSLIEALVARGRERGWRRLYWHAEADNKAARALYDRLTPVTDYVRYDIALQ